MCNASIASASSCAPRANEVFAQTVAPRDLCLQDQRVVRTRAGKRRAKPLFTLRRVVEVPQRGKVEGHGGVRGDDEEERRGSGTSSQTRAIH
jgi:hypothetical protein